ncbi:MAG: hypothetical protein E6Q97_16940 [Desulfurellales bacterium]|nr:MAG: hypothetical protein E6Q97_16940 [Desulfurellales bacterium]
MSGIASVQAQGALAGPAPAGLTNVTAGNRISVTTPMAGVRQVAALITRCARSIRVGAAVDGAITPDGSDYAPYPELADALAEIAASADAQYLVRCDAQDYADVVIGSGNKSAVISAGIASPGAAYVGKVTVTGNPGGGLPNFFEGFQIGEIDTVAAPGADPQAVLVLLGSGYSGTTVGPISNPANIGLILIGFGYLEAVSGFTSQTFASPIDLANAVSFAAFQNCDVQQEVKGGLIRFVDSKVPASVFSYGAGPIWFYETEDGGFPFATVVEFTDPGVLHLDQHSALNFVAAGGSIINGLAEIENGGPLAAMAAGAALAKGVPVYRDPTTLKALQVDGTEQALRYSFAGLTGLTSAADGDAQIVLSQGVTAYCAGGITGGVYGPLTPGKAYYCSGATGDSTTAWLVFSQDDFATFAADFATGHPWYRLLGQALTADTIALAFEDAGAL